MSTETKALQAIRSVLLGVSGITSYVGSNIYAAHISSISEPTYPAISLHLLAVQGQTAVPSMLSLRIQIDIWLNAKTYKLTDLFAISGLIRSVLHRCKLSSESIGVEMFMCLEEVSGQVMYESDMNLYHLPLRYGVVAL